MRNKNIFDEIIYPEINGLGVTTTTHLRNIRNYLSRDRSVLEKTMRVNNNDHFTPLLIAINMSDIAAVKVIVSFHPNLNRISESSRDYRPVTPLILAALRCHYEMVRILVNAGADISILSNGSNVIDILNDRIERIERDEIFDERKDLFIKIRNFLLKANHSARVIQGNYKNYITKKKTGAANVIKRNYLNYTYAPGGPGYNRAKKHFETAFGKKRTNLKTLRSDLKKVLK